MMKNYKGNKKEGGWVQWVVLVIVLLIAAAITAATSSDEPAESPIPGSNTCFTKCFGVLEYECGSNKFVGGCFGVWDCKAQIGAHSCR